MVVGLQGRALLALGQNDRGVDNLVELGQIEEPAKVSQALVPKTSSIGGVWHAVGQVHARVGNRPFISDRAVGSSVAVTTGSVNLAERVHDSNQTVGIIAVWERAAECLEHAHESPCGVDSQEDIVENDEQFEQSSVTERPWFISATFIDAVKQYHGERVDSGDCDGYPDVQHLVIKIVRDVEGLLPCEGVGVRRRNGHRELMGREGK